MCIRDSTENIFRAVNIALVNELKVIYDAMDIDVWEVIDAAATKPFGFMPFYPCLLYTSDAADERSSVDLGGRRIIKKKTHKFIRSTTRHITKQHETHNIHNHRSD